MIAVGWVDSKAVYFVSTADTTEITTVQRRIGSNKVEVWAPIAIANYNKWMGGVDRYDRLRSTFSLCKKRKICRKKYNYFSHFHVGVFFAMDSITLFISIGNN